MSLTCASSTSGKHYDTQIPFAYSLDYLIMSRYKGLTHQLPGAITKYHQMTTRSRELLNSKFLFICMSSRRPDIDTVHFPHISLSLNLFLDKGESFPSKVASHVVYLLAQTRVQVVCLHSISGRVSIIIINITRPQTLTQIPIYTTNPPHLKMLLPKLEPDKLIPNILTRMSNLPGRGTRPTEINTNLRLGLFNM